MSDFYKRVNQRLTTTRELLRSNREELEIDEDMRSLSDDNVDEPVLMINTAMFGEYACFHRVNHTCAWLLLQL